MAELKRQLNDLIKKAGSKVQARRDAEEWYQTALSNFRNKEVVKGGFLRFVPGKIYVFRYDTPKTVDTLEWWDRNPVVLALDPVDGNDCGINLNLLSVELKEMLLDMVYDRMKAQIMSQTLKAPKNAQAQARLAMSYAGAKRFLDQYGFGFAIRQYIPRLKKSQAVVAYENWAQIALCDFIELEGATVQQIRMQFYKYRRTNI